MKLLYKMKAEKENIIEDVKAIIAVDGFSEAEENIEPLQAE